MANSDTRVTVEPDRLPLPVALDAERAVLAAMLMDPSGETARKSAALLRNTMFWQQNHRLVFDAVLRIVARGEDPDLVTVAAELKARDEMDMVGGPEELSRILDYQTWGRSPEQHARIVREHYVRRELIHASDRLAETARTGEVRPDDAYATFVREIEQTAAPVSDVDELLRAAIAGPAFMGQQLDAPLNLLGDGLLPAGTLGMLHAGSGAGKTFLAEQLAHAVATGETWLNLFSTPAGGVPVVLVQLEVSPYELQKRRRTRYADGTPNLHTITADAIARNLNILDPGDFERIVRLVRGTAARLVVFDPAQELHGDGIEDNAAFHVLVRQLKLLMLKTGVAVLLVHHEPKAPVEKGSSRSDLDSARGGTRLSGACKLQMRLKRSPAGHWSLTFPKVSFGPKPADVPLAQTADGWWDATEAPVPAADRTMRTVEAYLRNAGEAGASYADLERAAECSRNSVKSALERIAVRSGLDGWKALKTGDRQHPRFVLQDVSCQQLSNAPSQQDEIEW